MQDFGYEGKVAIIAGGASGLGRSTADLMAEEGAQVVIADKNQERGEAAAKEIEAAGGTAVFRLTDVRQTEDVKSAVQYAEDTFGKLDIMVVTAGIVGGASMKRLEDVTEDEFLEIHNVNLFGTWRCFKYAAPAIRRAGGGSMSATSSMAGIETLSGGLLGAYSSSKAGVASVSSYFASELIKDRIRVNTVCPGGMATNIGESYPYATPELLELMNALMYSPKAWWEASYPVAEPIEIARVHLFLNSKLADFVTGQVLLADGGAFMNMPGAATGGWDINDPEALQAFIQQQTISK